MKTINVVAALIENSGKYFVAKRANGKLAGYWEFPGGKIKSGETNFQAIEREIKEELGIRVNAVSNIAHFKHEYSYAIIKLALIDCTLLDSNPKIVLDGSHSRYEWVDISNINIEFAPLDNKIVTHIRQAIN